MLSGTMQNFVVMALHGAGGGQVTLKVRGEGCTGQGRMAEGTFCHGCMLGSIRETAVAVAGGVSLCLEKADGCGKPGRFCKVQVRIMWLFSSTH